MNNSTLTITCTIQSLAVAPSLLKSRRPEILIIDMANLEFINCRILVRLKCIIDLAVELKIAIKIFPPDRGDTRDYAGRMGLFANTNYTYPYNINPPKAFLPLIKIENDINDHLHEELSRVFSHMLVPSSYIGSLAGTFTELADNMFYHAGAQSNMGWGYVCAQVFEKNPRISISLSDVGVGVYETYQRTNQVRGRSEKQILLDSFEQGESCLNPGPGKGYRGIGLWEARDYIQRFEHGTLLYRSGKHWVTIDHRGIRTRETGIVYAGTWIEMEVPII
jgi:hypothetical protein